MLLLLLLLQGDVEEMIAAEVGGLFMPHGEHWLQLSVLVGVMLMSNCNSACHVTCSSMQQQVSNVNNIGSYRCCRLLLLAAATGLGHLIGIDTHDIGQSYCSHPVLLLLLHVAAAAAAVAGLGHLIGIDTHDVGGYGEGFPERIQVN
jgi:hypothetical protein